VESGEKLWIITEADRSVTTLLLQRSTRLARRSKLEAVAVTTAPTIGTRSPQLGRLRPPVLRRTVVSEI
jgi:hypothetical protein